MNGKPTPGNLTQEQEYDCAEDCPIRILGEQSGECRSAYPGNPEGALRQIGKPKVGKGKHFEGWGSISNGVQNTARYSDTGTAARYFQQFPPDLWSEEVTP